MPDHDPEGLDVARMVAGQAKGATPAKGAPRRAPKPTSARPAGDPLPLGEAIDDLIAEQGWSREVNLHHLLGRWSALVGPAIAEHSHPERFANGVLVVRAESTGWATNLRQFAAQLVAKLNEALGDGTVVRVVIEGPEAPSWSHGKRSVRGGRGPRDTYG